jgi:endogenous inhibitor of DNA gyrase (YacG/DUF329 family)
MAKDDLKLNCALCGTPTNERLRMNPYCPRCKKQVSDHRKERKQHHEVLQADR